MTRFLRLRSERDFRELFRRGRRSEKKYFRIVWLPSVSATLAVAFIAPRAIEKRATRRNRIRRQAREWVRRHVDASAVPLRVAVTFKKGAVEAPKHALYAELEATFDHLARSSRPY